MPSDQLQYNRVGFFFSIMMELIELLIHIWSFKQCNNCCFLKLQSQGWSFSDLEENIAAMYSSLEASLITEQEIKDSIVYRDNRKWRRILALRPAAEKERLHMWHLAIWTLVKRGTAAWNLSKPRWSPKRKTPNQTFSEPYLCVFHFERYL